MQLGFGTGEQTMELNNEEIKRCLAEYEVVCDNCACNDGDTIGKQIMLNALALINEQEQKIKELENRNEILEALNKVNDKVGMDFIRECKKNKRLIEENKRLSESYDHLEKTKDELIVENLRLKLRLAECENIL